MFSKKYSITFQRGGGLPKTNAISKGVRKYSNVGTLCKLS